MIPNALPPIPHAGPARLVTRIVHRGAAEIVCEGRIPADGPWVGHGRCPSFVLLELAAQSAAVLEALQPAAAHGTAPLPDAIPRAGTIVRVRGLILARSSVQPGRPLRARVARGAAAPPLFLFSVRVEDESGQEILSGELGLHLPEDGQAAVRTVSHPVQEAGVSSSGRGRSPRTEARPARHFRRGNAPR